MPNKFQRRYQKSKSSEKQIKRKSRVSFGIITAFLIILLPIVFYERLPDFLKIGKDGKIGLTKDRTQKIEQLEKEVNNCIVYLLRAVEDGYYPCESCVATTRIFLLEDEIWYIGSTRKEKEGRYKGNYFEKFDVYFEEVFRGRLDKCILEERRRIINYATLPENLKRNEPLIRPPGNSND